MPLLKFKIGDTAIDPMDKKWVVDNPNYNVEENKAVIERTIRAAEAVYKKKAKEHDDDYAERADAVVSYLKSLDRASSTGIGSSTNIDKYFGRRMLAQLRGDAIRERLMSGITVRTPDGHLLKRGS